MTHKLIDNFSGDFAFLSNFYYTGVVYDGIFYPSSEHAYQAAKSLDIADRMSVKKSGGPAQAKRRGKEIKKREDWDTVKYSVMEDILRIKFADPILKEMLIATEDYELVEGNHWHDYYWGVCNGTGENNLGKLLMKIRSELMVDTAQA
jgi:ribA/ribD-fused uncharacterized protein